MGFARHVWSVALLPLVSACPIGDLTSGDDAQAVDALVENTPVDAPADVMAWDVAAVDSACTAELDAAPPLGTTILQPTTDTNGNGAIEAFRVVASRDACASTAAIYIALLGPPVLIGVYSDVGGPGTLIAQAQIPSPLAGWNTAPLDQVVNVTSGQVLWFAITSSNGADLTYLDFGPDGSTSFNASPVVDDAGHQSFPALFNTTFTNHDSPITGYLQ